MTPRLEMRGSNGTDHKYPGRGFIVGVLKDGDDTGQVPVIATRKMDVFGEYLQVVVLVVLHWYNDL